MNINITLKNYKNGQLCISFGQVWCQI